MSHYRLLCQQEDSLGPIWVLEDDEYRVLAFAENDEQSKISKKSPHIPAHSYVQAMLQVLLFSEPRSAIVLGLGGGALVHALRRFDAAIKITAVELREQVITLAQRYFYLPIGKKVTLLNQDAMQFLSEKSHKRVDIIFADIYGAEGVDAKQLDPDFLNNCGGLLKDNGILVLNCWREHSQNEALYRQLKMLFPELYGCLTSGGNWIVFAARRPGQLSLDGIKSRNAALSERLDFQLGKTNIRFGVWDGPLT
ncbi:spermidine synthase [Shewanella cyperi]|uniref:spermidine synthase n=1 Tax=Shewanella cyperi TaxID=2814292 RepID=UPI001A93E480|nr:spermidine synthase [Shewanella cyperi]QSX41342.1 spermidine synthase [Shewanella cyperi]